MYDWRGKFIEPDDGWRPEPVRVRRQQHDRSKFSVLCDGIFRGYIERRDRKWVAHFYQSVLRPATFERFRDALMRFGVLS